MEKSINKILKSSVWVSLSVISAVALPQIFHYFGIISGNGGSFGQMFLPMYLPVLILAFRTNALLGVISGILSPIISFSLTAMPNTDMLPYITIELVCFGLFAGLLADKRWNPFVKILLVQILSRIVRIAATLIIVSFVQSAVITSTVIFNTVITAIPGYILQLLVVPYFINKRCS